MPSLARRARLGALALFAVLAALGALGAGCGGYTSALGYRARQAVLAHDVGAFEGLMAEAAETAPAGPRDDPKKTVLTHFLDLAGDARFFPLVEAWRAKGWVDDDLVCSIHRAHYRAVRAIDPAGAERSARTCLDVARAAAPDPARAWQVKDCLEEAAFLTETATAALVPYLQRVADAGEPYRFRAALLDGLTYAAVSSPDRRAANDPSLGPDGARREVERELARLEARFRWIIAAARPYVDGALLAGGTARGALELEQTAGALGRSFLARFAESDAPDEVELAWAWVRTLKARSRDPNLASLALWNRDREPLEDAHWYACTRSAPPPPPGSPAAALGELLSVETVTVRTAERVEDREPLRARCREALAGPEGAPGADWSAVLGPYPLEATARAAVAEAAARGAPKGAHVSVVLRARLVR